MPFEPTTWAYAAFLRGVNLGPHKRIEMEGLRRAFEAAGYQNVKTILASGNVLFEAAPVRARQKATLPDKEPSFCLAPTDLNGTVIEQMLEKAFGFKVEVFLRTARQLEELVQSDPFKDIPITPQTRLYVTFLSEPPATRLEIPYETPEKDFRIIRVSSSEVCSVVELSAARGTTEAMKFLDREFGRKTTTRNWNTILKMCR